MKFRTDGYQHHLSTAHAEMWDEYQELETKDEKEQFFKSRSALLDSLDEQSAHLHSRECADY